jgi:hypothetical protein
LHLLLGFFGGGRLGGVLLYLGGWNVDGFMEVDMVLVRVGDAFNWRYVLRLIF